MKSFSSVAGAWKPGWLTRAFARFERPDARFTDEEILTVIRAGEGLRVADVCAAADIPVETFYTWKARYGGLTLEALREERRSERRKATTKRLAVTVLLAGFAIGVAVLVGSLNRPAPIERAATPQPAPRPNEVSTPVGVDGTKPVVPGDTSVAPDSNSARLNPAGELRPPPSSASDSKPGATSGIPSKPGPASAQPGGKPSPPAGIEGAAPGARPSVPPPVTTTNSSTPARTAADEPKPIPSTGARPTETHRNVPDLVTSAPEGISVQVAAFPDLNEARMTVAKLKNAGYPVYMMLTVVNQNELYRVRVGPLKSRELAQIMAQRLERDGYAAPWITSR